MEAHHLEDVAAVRGANHHDLDRRVVETDDPIDPLAAEHPGLAAVEAEQREEPHCLVEVLDDQADVDEAGYAGAMAVHLRSNDSLQIAGLPGRHDIGRGPILLDSAMTDERVDHYIDGMIDWQRDLARRIRALIHEADGEIEETIKRRVQPYFVLNGNVAAFLATKDHLNVFIYDPTVPDPAGIINRGHDNSTGRQIALYEGDSFDETAFKELIRNVADRNRAGGWRKLDG